MNENIPMDIETSVAFIRSLVKMKPQVAIVLGSGLGDFADTFSPRTEIETARIPGYPKSTVQGHRGKLIFGRRYGLPIVAFQGRVHLYESGNLDWTLFPIRVAHALGVQTLIVTNAAGGANPKFDAGTLMLITDQINLTFEQPLKKTTLFATHHAPLYDIALQNVVKEVAREKKIPIERGVYCGLKGPSYETAAEVSMLQRLGADAIGMSTVNEVILAVALGMRVAGISCITNLGTGLALHTLSHAEVTEVANRVKGSFAALLDGVIKRISTE